MWLCLLIFYDYDYNISCLHVLYMNAASRLRKSKNSLRVCLSHMLCSCTCICTCVLHLYIQMCTYFACTSIHGRMLFTRRTHMLLTCNARANVRASHTRMYRSCSPHTAQPKPKGVTVDPEGDAVMMMMLGDHDELTETRTGS